MKAGWEVKPLGEVAEIRPPKKLAKAALSDSDLVSFAGMSELGELQANFAEADARPLSKVYKNYTYFADNDVLIAKITPCFENGKMGIARNLTNGVGFGSSEFVPLRTNGEITSEFLFYFLLRDKFRKDGAKVMSGAVGHKRVPHEYFSELLTPIPPLDEQKRIVAVLDAAFEGLTRAKENAETNLQNARELFESSLGFLFSQSDGWQVSALNDHVAFMDYRGKTPPKREAGVRLITAKNVKRGFVQVEPKEFIDADAYDAWMTRGFPEKGDVLFTTEAPLANVAQLDTSEKVVIGQRLITMKPDRTKIDREFLKFALMSPQMQKEIFSLATGATVLGIKAKLLKTVEFKFPRDFEQQRSVASQCRASFENMDALTDVYRIKLQDIADLRQSLLQKAFAGELT